MCFRRDFIIFLVLLSGLLLSESAFCWRGFSRSKRPVASVDSCGCVSKRSAADSRNVNYIKTGSGMVLDAEVFSEKASKAKKSGGSKKKKSLKKRSPREGLEYKSVCSKKKARGRSAAGVKKAYVASKKKPESKSSKSSAVDALGRVAGGLLRDTGVDQSGKKSVKRDSASRVVSGSSSSLKKKRAKGKKVVAKKDGEKRKSPAGGISGVGANGRLGAGFKGKVVEGGSSGPKKKFKAAGNLRVPSGVGNGLGKKVYGYLGDRIRPWEFVEGEKDIEINFENARLRQFIEFIEKEYGLRFILDDSLVFPEGDTSQAAKENAVKALFLDTVFSFRTEKPFNKRQAWDIFLAFLNMANLTVLPGPEKKVFRITQAIKTNGPRSAGESLVKEPIPTFIGTDPAIIPNNDTLIRYVYYIQNIGVNSLKELVEKMSSPVGDPPLVLGELGVVVLVDRASTIHSILNVLDEIDSSILPEKLAIMPIKNRDAESLKSICDGLKQQEKEVNEGGRRFFSTGKKMGGAVFSDVSFAVDKRLNSLILMGVQDSVDKTEEFIREELDREPDLPYPSLHVYRVKFLQAEEAKNILTDLIRGVDSRGDKSSRAGKLFAGYKYLSPDITVSAESSTNSLVINADYEDYLQISRLLDKLDVEQPQVAVQILVLNITKKTTKQIGSQMRTIVPMLGDLLSKNITFQTSGMPTGQRGEGSNPFTKVELRPQDSNNENYGVTALLGNLINLASSHVAGSTLITLGRDIFGIWGLFKVLDSLSNVSTLGKPFLTVNNKVEATLNAIDSRRIPDATIFAEKERTTYKTEDAGLKVTLTPIISTDEGLVTLDIVLTNSQFTSGAPAGLQATSDTAKQDLRAGNRDEQSLSTRVTLSDNQVLAIGGLSSDRGVETSYSFPVLGKIPILGWLAKSKAQDLVKTNLLVLISVKILDSDSREEVDEFASQRIVAINEALMDMKADEQQKDPIHVLFFDDRRDEEVQLQTLDEFMEGSVLENGGLEDGALNGDDKSKKVKNGKSSRVNNSVDAKSFRPDSRPYSASRGTVGRAP